MAKDEKVPSAMPLAPGRKTNWHIQQMKDKGEKISMVGTASCDPIWACACEAAGVDMIRFVGPGENAATREESIKWQLREIRKLAPRINLNAVLQSDSYADPSKAVSRASELLTDGADSVLCMGLTNETLKYMSDNWVPVFGHVGCLSGWQTGWFGGYKFVGKTAEDAMKIFRMAYEYQENGMIGMTIELSSREVTDLIAKKLRIPVISVAAGGVADGSELVIFDLLGFQPIATMPKHAKHYRAFFEDAIVAFGEFHNDIKTMAYPEEVHGWSMNEVEFDKFANLVEQKYGDAKPPEIRTY